MRRKGANPGDLRLQRLAAAIDALADRDEKSLERAREIARLRRSAAALAHRVCFDFVSAVNTMLSRTVVDLDPPHYAEESFDEEGPNLIQINVRGRILQVAFAATPELTSTEEFRVPYTLEGSVRAFSQELLDKDLIEEQLLFYTVEKAHGMWRYFDPRTYRSGPFDRDYLISLMERLL